MARDHSIDDYFGFRTLSEAELTADDSWLVFSTSRTHKEKGKTMEGSVIVQSMKDNSILAEFQDAGTKNHSPSASPDSSRIAYIQERDKERHLVISDLNGSNTEKVVLEGEAKRLTWLTDNRILILMTEPESESIKKEKEAGGDGFFFEEDLKYTSLYIYGPGSGFKKITSGVQVWEYDISDSTVAFVGSAEPTESSWYKSRIYVQGLDQSSAKQSYIPEWRPVAKPRISPDGKKIAFLESLWSDRGVTSGDILVVDVESGKTDNITDGHDRSYCDMHWSGNGQLIALWTREGTAGIGSYDGKWEYHWSSEGTVFPTFSPEFSLSGKKVIFSYTDANTPLEVFLFESGQIGKLTHINDALLNLKRYKTEVVRWKSIDGLEIYGILKYENERNPLIVSVHGGPTSFSPVSFIDRSTPYIAKGYSIFYPNYRGSIGKGRKFAEANRGDMGGKDFQDILSGIEYLRKSGKIKTSSIFITGGSYGGFMVSWAITQTDVFSGAVGLFGITDWISFHGVTNIPVWDAIHYDQSPYARDLFEKFSAMNYLENVKTPVLLQHGIDDPCVPVGQYFQFYRGLKDLGKTVRLILYPREGHGFYEKKHIVMQFDETLKWFDKYRSG